MQGIARMVPEVNLNEYLRAVALASLKGVESILPR